MVETILSNQTSEVCLFTFMACVLGQGLTITADSEFQNILEGGGHCPPNNNIGGGGGGGHM